MGERLAAMTGVGPQDQVAVASGQHVWVDGHVPGLLAGWVRAATGEWWGRVAVVDSDGEAAVYEIRAERLRPARADD